MSQPAASRERPLKLLIKANFKELFRDNRTLISMSVFFFVTILVLIAIQFMINGDGSSPKVKIDPSVDSEIVERFSTSPDLEVVKSSTDDSANAQLRQTEGKYSLVVSSEDRPDWLKIVSVLEKDVPYSDIAVVDDQGSPQIDFLRQNLSLALLTGFASIAFVGTAAPFARMRNEGIMTMLSTTPARPRDILVSHAPPRIILCAVESVIILAIAYFNGYLTGGNSFRLLGSLLLSFSLIFCFGYVLAARARNPEIVTQLAGLVPIVVLFGSGTVIPIPFLSDTPWLRYLIPTNWLADAINYDLSGIQPDLSWGWLWLFMALGAALLFILSLLLFKWGNSDE